MLLIDDSADSKQAENLLKEHNVKFLTVRPSGAVRRTLPMLFDGGRRVVGYSLIREFAEKKLAKRTMNQDLDLTVSALEELDVKPDMSSFDNRLRMQKIVFLLQKFGLSTSWNFNWYLRGPYSSALAHQLYDNRKKGSRLQNLSSRDKKAISILKENFDVKDISSYDLETAASVLYILKNFRNSVEEADLVSLISRLKPNLSESSIRKYVRKFSAMLQLATG